MKNGWNLMADGTRKISIYRWAVEENARLREQKKQAEELKKKLMAKRFPKPKRRRPRSMPPNSSSRDIYVDGASRPGKHFWNKERNRYLD
jgi:hypothetical protein